MNIHSHFQVYSYDDHTKWRILKTKLMKTRIFRGCSLGLALSLLPFVGGCNQQTSDKPQSLISVAEAETAMPAAGTNTAPPAEVTNRTNTLSTDKPVAAEPATAEQPLPPNVRPSSPLAEVIKLAQAGVDEGVLQSFVANSTGTFNLDSDGIIYLSDIGVPNGIINAMIERDQTLKNQWANSASTAAAATGGSSEVTQATGNTPSYETPQQLEETAPPATAPEQQQPANVTYNNFYNSLAPYGSWVNVDGYGYCWQPNVVVVNPGWQPYCDRGRWIYSDCGWYWLSDYTWGWAPFHYGRWFRHPRWGWCWWPDRVWGPAWVSWRYSDAYCGWAPLPPAARFGWGVGFTFNGGAVGVGFDFGLGFDSYTFVPWGHVWDHRPYRYRVPHDRGVAIFHGTTPVNNIVQGNNNTVINRGIPADRVEHFTGRELHPIQIRENATGTPRGERGERFARDNQTIIVNRPPFEDRPRGNAVTSPAPTHPTSGQGAVTVIGAGHGGAMPSAAQRSPGRDLNPRTSPPETTHRENPQPGNVRRDRQGPSSSNESDRRADIQNPSPVLPPTETARQNTPQSSVVVIGTRDVATPHSISPRAASSSPNVERGRAAGQNNPMNQNPSQSFTRPASGRASPSYNWTAPETSASERQEIPRVSRSIQDRDFSRPVYSTPAEQQLYSPTYYAPSAASPTERPQNSAPRSSASQSPRFERAAPAANASPSQHVAPRGGASERNRSDSVPSPSPRSEGRRDRQD